MSPHTHRQLEQSDSMYRDPLAAARGICWVICISVFAYGLPALWFFTR